ncbi:ATP-binding protein [Limnohabitans sp. DM1]|uniref:AAA family ATPase n=1 Tax=Limnohabitans sp. DM1 TaxID=1597955 RepID=UPI000B0E4F44|nr:ATP-binding protein [Limnohabitans sp. DM1]
MSTQTRLNTPTHASTTDHYDADFSIARLWVLRLLVTLKGHRTFITPYGFDEKELARWLGLLDTLTEEQEDEAPKPTPTRLTLTRMLAQAERRVHQIQVPTTLASNVARIAALVGLSDVECRVLEFVLLMRGNQHLNQACEHVKNLDTPSLAHALGVILGQSSEDIRQALRSDGLLAKTGLVTVDMRSGRSLDCKFDLLCNKLPHRLIESEMQPTDWLKDMIVPSGPGHLDFDDYVHCAKALQVLRPYLRQALDQGQRGVNVLLYGPPGTGKTQLVKLLAKDLGCELFEVTTEDEDEEPISGRKRIKALSATHSLFARRQALVMFDEIEDAFNSPDETDTKLSDMFKRSPGRTKGWINRLLETNQLPTVWIGNSLMGMDAAFIRRFDVVLEMPVPPQTQRERIIRSASGGLLSEAAVKRIAQSEALAPAVVTRTSRVIQSIATQLPDGQVTPALELLINQTLQAQSHPTLARHNPNSLPEVYDPAFVNTDTDLLAMAAQMRQHQTGRICLYGPPGTGKTAYGRWLALELGKPLHVKRASDLISMWVGETEKNLAKAFAQAEEADALLLIDEVDTFLQNREGAQRSWEVSQVNEMLTQMESFGGVFIASTNLMAGLDSAALRRFDLKLKFDYLKTPQALQLLQRHCQHMGLGEPTPQDRQALASLGQLTPGDYAAVVRQSRLRPIQSASHMVQALAEECALKPGAQTRSIGFIA